MVKKVDEGVSVDDAFADDDDVIYAESKKKVKKSEKAKGKNEEKVKNSDFEQGEIKIKQGKPITELRKGDKIKINGREFEVDANIVLIEHDKDTKEMALEIFDAKKDEDFQLRYFTNNVENSFEFYELQGDFMYVRLREELKSVEW